MAAAPAQAGFTYARAIGSLGDGPGQLKYPTELAAAQGNVYVTDWGNNRVTVFTPDGKPNGFFSQTKDAALAGPVAIQAANNRLYVLEMNAGRISLFTFKGEYKGSIGGDLGLNHPRDFRVVKDKIYIADTDNNRVVITNLQGVRTGVFNGLKGPRGIDLAFERLLVAHPEESRITQINTTTGYPSRALGADGTLRGPRRLTTGGEWLFVSDYANSRVLVYDKNSQMIQQVGGGILKNPEGMLWLADRKELWVADAENDRLAVFRFTPGFEPVPAIVPPVAIAPPPAAVKPEEEEFTRLVNTLQGALAEKQRAAVAYKSAAEKSDRFSMDYARYATRFLGKAALLPQSASLQFVLDAAKPSVVAVYAGGGEVVVGVIPLAGKPFFSAPFSGALDRVRFLDFDRDNLEDIVLDLDAGGEKQRYFLKADSAAAKVSLALGLPIKTSAHESKTFFEGKRLFEVRRQVAGGEALIRYSYTGGVFVEEKN